MTQAQMDGMYAVLSDADADGDAEVLADAAWRLFEETAQAQAQAEAREMRAALAELAAAARAAIAAASAEAPDPLAQLLATPPACGTARAA